MAQLLSAYIVIALLVGAGDDEKAKAIYAKATEAHGSLRAEHLRAYQVSCKIGDDLMEIWSQSPDRLRIESKFTRDAKDYETLVVVRGDQGWLKFLDGVVALDKDKIRGFKTGLPPKLLLNALPSDSAGLNLSYLGEKRIGERLCDGIRVVTKQDEPSEFYFDKKSALLARASTKGVDPADPTKKNDIEMTFGAYKKFGTLLFPSKLSMNAGGVETPIIITAFRLADKLDDKLFQEPKDD